MSETIVGFVGFGLIGGSIARALKQLHPDFKLLAYNYYHKDNSSLTLAQSEGVLDLITTSLEDDFKTCDLIFLCAPVLKNIEYLPLLKSCIKPTCIITDVGSTKQDIHQAVHRLHMDHQFIGGHPMAGSEKTGYHSSHATLLENAYYVLTPGMGVPTERINFLIHLVEDMKAIPIVLDASYHDDVVAAISHVPHIIASSLVNMVKDCDDDKELMKQLAAGGFKDITRIASSSPVMWENICLSNKNSILKFLKIYITYLVDMVVTIEKEDDRGLIHLFETAKEYRDRIPSKTIGLIDRVFEVYVDLIDEAGAIATIATILASNSISIKNIGILHNREFEEGVLRIELYDPISSQKTVELLKHYHYTIYER